jgi:hypothetical protein
VINTRQMLSALIAAGMISICAPAHAVIISTVTFQNGTDGYTGTFDRRMTASGSGNTNGSLINTDAASYFIDGGSSALNDAGAQQALIRFDNFVGGSGVPANATIISAKVEVTTNGTSNSQSGGAHNIYRLTTGFDSTSSYASPFGGNGLAGDVDQILGSFDAPAQNTPISARVDKAVQGWVNGGTNLGFGIRSDRSTDGWSIHSTGSATVANRPKLIVDYTTDPTVFAKSYQQGINGYTSTVDILLNSAGTGNTVDGSTLNEVFLDGDDGLGTSFDEPALLRFNNIDLAYNQILKAELIIKTGFSSASADTPGPITVHQLLQDWNTTTTYASLDSDMNPMLNSSTELLAGGVIGPAISTVTGANDTEVMYLDITSIVENWRAGAPNYGVYIGAGTTNGWQIFMSGATDPNFAPELRVVGVVPEPSTLMLGGVALAGLATMALRRRKQE